MEYGRQQMEKLEKRLGKGKAIVILGPRQVGKTTLIHTLLKDKEYLFLNADDPQVRASLTNPNTEELKLIVGDYKYLFIDEAQLIPNIGRTLKIITDTMQEVQLVVSGSSSLDLANQLNEPLTGRKREFQLFPISWKELEDKEGYLAAKQQLKHRLIYGFYPEVLNSKGDEPEVLKELMSSYLYKDILALGGIRKPQFLEKLVKALALQLGSEVSYNELSQLVGVDKNTISNYIDLLEKGFVLFRLGSLSGNIRNEIKTNQKIYFYDVGIRNAVIGNFSAIENRTDIGGLWENFLIAERIKQIAYSGKIQSNYFWRTKQQQEIDWVEESAGKISGFEFKWNPKAKVKIPKKFMETYDAEVKVYTSENFREFVV
jgi:hypothetical protein